MNYKKYIAKPFVLKLELVKGCNLRCKFCPVNSHPDEYQVPDNREIIDKHINKVICSGINDLNENIRVELTGRGEPTLHPYVLNRLDEMRELIPRAQISMFTNGVMILKNRKLLTDLIKHGCNIVNIDCYNNTYDRFKKIAEEEIVGSDIELMDFREFSAYKRYNNGHKLKVISLVPDIADEDHLVRVRKVHNMAGNLSSEQMKNFGLTKLKEPLKKMCTRPFREYQIHADGTVSLCCHDWSEDLVLGKVSKAEDVIDIWYGKNHHDTLLSLYKRDRSFSPCNKCDYFGGFRVGIVTNPTTGYDPFKH